MYTIDQHYQTLDTEGHTPDLNFTHSLHPTDVINAEWLGHFTAGADFRLPLALWRPIPLFTLVTRRPWSSEFLEFLKKYEILCKYLVLGHGGGSEMVPFLSLALLKM